MQQKADMVPKDERMQIQPIRNSIQPQYFVITQTQFSA